MQNKRLHIIVFVLFAVFVSCCGRGKSVQSGYSGSNAAIELNDAAVELMFVTDEDTVRRDSMLNLALTKLDEAIAIDSLYVTARQNKSQVLRMLGRNSESVSTLERLLRISNTPEHNFALGVTCEKTGDTLSAQRYYREAVAAYDRILADKPDSMPVLMNRYFTLFFIQGKDKTMAQMRELLENDHGPSEEYMMLFEEFDKTEFITQF
jgi:tetratricopeptide (TPR) repeat protein